MPLSDDPAKREKQLANLRKSEGAVKHGATSERKLAPLRAKHRAELLERLPTIDEHRLRLLSDLLARIDLASEYVDVHGLMRNTRETHPILEILTRWERRAWDMLSQLQPRSQPAGMPENVRDWVNDWDDEVQQAAHNFLDVSRRARERRQAAEKAAKDAAK